MQTTKQMSSQRLAQWCAAVLIVTGAVSLADAAQAPQTSGIAFRASANSDNDAGARTINVKTPAGTVANDVMIATVFVRGAVREARSTSTVTPPAGWTLIRRDEGTVEGVPGGISSMVSYYRVATASEPASHTWTFDTGRLAIASIASYSGVSTSAPIDAHGGQPSSGASTSTMAAPSITTTVGNALVVGLFGLHEGGQSTTPPAGMTERFDQTSSGSNLTLEMADELRATPGPTGQKAAVASFTDTSVAQLFALKPASSGPAKTPR